MVERSDSTLVPTTFSPNSTFALQQELLMAVSQPTDRDSVVARITKPSPKPPGMGSVLMRNIDMLKSRRDQEEAAASFQERLAAVITRFTGSMAFVYLHLVLFGSWIVVNLGLLSSIPKFDPSFVILAMMASVEAIFLSTFVLISQNRMAAAADKRADLDLQINLLAEHEVTKLITMVSAIADHLNIKTNIEIEIEELKQDVAPEAVLDEIEEEQKLPMSG
jgi:uncharacterized membrane protein